MKLVEVANSRFIHRLINVSSQERFVVGPLIDPSFCLGGLCFLVVRLSVGVRMISGSF